MRSTSFTSGIYSKETSIKDIKTLTLNVDLPGNAFLLFFILSCPPEVGHFHNCTFKEYKTMARGFTFANMREEFFTFAKRKIFLSLEVKFFYSFPLNVK